MLSRLDSEEAVEVAERFRYSDLDLEVVTFPGHNELDWEEAKDTLDWEEAKAAPFVDCTEMDVDKYWVVE